MITKIVKIGNSSGIRLPKNIIERYFSNRVANIEFLDNEIKLKPVNTVRKDWDILFKTKSEEPIEFLENDFDKDEWEW